MRYLFSLLKVLVHPFRALSRDPRIRYSNDFRGASLSAREIMLKTAFQFAHASQVEGDYFEFGVYKGANVAAAFHLARNNGLTNMRFVAFDSFEGLPKIKNLDAKFAQYQEGQYAYGKQLFEENLKVNRVDMKSVTIVPGWFSDSLNRETKKRLGSRKAAVIWVDCDLYESTVPVLDFIVDFIEDGTVLIFDDWNSFRGNPERGERKAFADWFKKHPELTVHEFHRFGWHGNSFIINTDHA